jgi:hypothetical protein
LLCQAWSLNCQAIIFRFLVRARIPFCFSTHSYEFLIRFQVNSSTTASFRLVFFSCLMLNCFFFHLLFNDDNVAERAWPLSLCCQKQLSNLGLCLSLGCVSNPQAITYPVRCRRQQLKNWLSFRRKK